MDNRELFSENVIDEDIVSESELDGCVNENRVDSVTIDSKIVLRMLFGNMELVFISCFFVEFPKYKVDNGELALIAKNTMDEI